MMNLCMSFLIDLEYLDRVLVTDMSNHGVQGWTEAIALDRFFEETVYATICQGRKICPWI